MRLDEQLRGRGPGAPVRPGGGSRVPALIVVALVVVSGGIFLATQMRDADPPSRNAEPQLEDLLEEAPPPFARRGADRVQDSYNPASWVTNDDYPAEALRNGEQGSVGIEFTVTPNGRVSDCKVAQSSGSQLLDRTTCMLVTERARYRPARDTQGHPVAQNKRLRFRWQIAE